MQRRNKGVNESVTYIVDFARALETVWMPGKSYSLTTYIRPPVANGFEYECTNAGQSAQDEPEWSETIAAAFSDGSVEWTTRDFALNASDTISARTVTAESGLTVASDSIAGTTVLAQLTGGTAGGTYDVTYQIVTTAGDTYEELLRITVIE